MRVRASRRHDRLSWPFLIAVAMLYFVIGASAGYGLGYRDAMRDLRGRRPPAPAPRPEPEYPEDMSIPYDLPVGAVAVSDPGNQASLILPEMAVCSSVFVAPASEAAILVAAGRDAAPYSEFGAFTNTSALSRAFIVNPAYRYVAVKPFGVGSADQSFFMRIASRRAVLPPNQTAWPAWWDKQVLGIVEAQLCTVPVPGLTGGLFCDNFFVHKDLGISPPDMQLIQDAAPVNYPGWFVFARAGAPVLEIEFSNAETTGLGASAGATSFNALFFTF